MSDQRERSSLFTALKTILKAQGIRYKDLAVLMQTSEPTIKRLFQEQDCKLSRLIEICDVLGISFNDLMKVASETPLKSTELPIESETALANHPALAATFILLVSDISVAQIRENGELSTSDMYLHLRELEKLELIRLGINDSVHFLVKRPIRWRLNGPLHTMLVQANQSFLKDVLSTHEENGMPFYSPSRLLSQHSIKKLSEDIEKLYQTFQRQAELDQMFYPTNELQPFKMIATVSPFDIARYFKIKPEA